MSKIRVETLNGKIWDFIELFEPWESDDNYMIFYFEPGGHVIIKKDLIAYIHTTAKLLI